MATGNPILISKSDQTFEILRPVSFSRNDIASFDETLLQRLVDETPGILPIRDFYPSVISIKSLGREIPINLGERSGYIDNLLVTNDGHLVLVETKLYRNPEAIRDAVIQTLEYGMAINTMSLLELEARLRRAEKTESTLKDNESILTKATDLDGLIDDFEIALERFLRTGEILLLVVADGIRTSVERITQWMNEVISSSSPIKFGLVELRFYEQADGSRFAVPKTLLKTKEILRHVVVVDIQNSSVAQASATVTDQLDSLRSTNASRSVKVASPLTKTELKHQVSDADGLIIDELYQQLESIGFSENTKGATQLRYGVYLDTNNEYLPLIYLTKNDIWLSPVKKVREIVGADYILRFRREMNHIVEFWRSDQLEKLDTSGCAVKYQSIKNNIPAFIDKLEELKHEIMNRASDIDFSAN